ncbi:MAG: PIG-L family deacetylase [Terrimesophilobacter sp.]
MNTPQVREHVLFVHAHPDDETISTGGTIATLLDAGADVTLVTCTRGELGEVVPPELQHLSGDALGAYRETELAAAMSALHLKDFRMLGADNARAEGTGPHVFLDSGMQWGRGGAGPLDGAEALTTAEHDPVRATLTSADLEVVVADLAAVIAEVQPTAVVSYDARGGYGHPDHIRAHDAAGTAAIRMSVPFYTIVPDGQNAPDDLVVDVSPVVERKKAALRAHRTQLTVEGDTIVHSGGQVEPIRHTEVFRRFRQRRQSALAWENLELSSRIIACFLALLVGAVVGAVGTANYQFAGAAISLLLVAGLLSGLRLLFGTRIVAFCAALGVLVVVGVLSRESVGGSVLVQATAVGFLWTYAPTAIAVLVIVWPRLLRRPRDTMEKSSAPGKAVDAS